jgi:hypothetical protein
MAVAGKQLPLYELEQARVQLQELESERLVLHSKKERAEAEAERLQKKHSLSAKKVEKMKAELAKTNDAQDRAKEETDKAKDAQARAEEETDKAKDAQDRAEAETGKAKDAQDRAEEETGKAKDAQDRAEEETGKAKDAQARAEEETGKAKDAQARGEEETGKAKDAQAKAEEETGKTKDAQDRAEEETGKAKDAQARAEAEAEKAKDSQRVTAEEKVGLLAAIRELEQHVCLTPVSPTTPEKRPTEGEFRFPSPVFPPPFVLFHPYFQPPLSFSSSFLLMHAGHPGQCKHFTSKKVNGERVQCALCDMCCTRGKLHGKYQFENCGATTTAGHPCRNCKFCCTYHKVCGATTTAGHPCRNCKFCCTYHKGAQEKTMHQQEQGEELTGHNLAGSDISGEHYRITGDGSKMDAEDAYVRHSQGFLPESPGSPSVSKRLLLGNQFENCGATTMAGHPCRNCKFCCIYHKGAQEKTMHQQEQGEELTGHQLAGGSDISGEHYRITGDGSKMDAEDAYVRHSQGFLPESPGLPSVSRRLLLASSPSTPLKSSAEKPSPWKDDKKN